MHLVSWRVVLLVAVLSHCLIETSLACGGHGHDHWSKSVEIRGRRRTLLSMNGRKCGTDQPTQEEVDEIETKHGNFERKEAFVPGDGPNGARVYTINTYVTIVMIDDGSKSGDVDDAAVKKQIKMLNDAYAVNAAGHGVKWDFKLMGIKRVTGPSMCDKDAEQQLKALHRQGGANALNLYFTDLGDCGLLGFSTWPWQAKDAAKDDGVVIHFDTLPGGQEAPYNLGRTSVHEVGHWMGLYHTFQNGCTRGGDMVADTPFAAGPTTGCPAYRDSCSEPGQDPIHNYMDYSDDVCMHQFTQLQHQRMESQFRQYRLAKK